MKTRHHFAAYLILLLVMTFSAMTSSAQSNFLPSLDAMDWIPSDPTHLTTLARLGRGWSSDVTWSPDRKTIAVASSVGIWLYQADNLDAVPVLLSDEPEVINVVAFSPDSTLLAAGGDRIQLWDTQTDRVVTSIHTDVLVNTLDFSPDGKRLVASILNSNGPIGVSLWNVATGDKERDLYKPGGGNMFDISFSPDGKLIAAIFQGNGEFSPTFWDANSGELLNFNEIGFLLSQVQIAFSPDSQSITLLAETGGISSWNLQTGQRENEFSVEADNLKSMYFPPGMMYTPDGSRVVALSSDGVLRIWDAKTLHLLHQYDLGQTAKSAHISPDGKQIAAVNRESGLGIWDMETGQVIAKTGNQAIPGGKVGFSRDGKLLASIGEDNEIWLWDLMTGERTLTLTGHTARINDFAFSHDGTLLLTASDDNTARAWDIPTGEIRYEITAHNAAVLKVMVTWDDLLLTAGADNTFRLWDLRTGEPKGLIYDVATDTYLGNTLEAPTAPGDIHAAAFSGWDIAVADSLGTIYASSPGRNDPEWKTITHDPYSRPVNDLSFSEGLVSAGNDGAVQVWDTNSGDHIAVLTRHEGWIYSFALMHNEGGIMASAGCIVPYMDYPTESSDKECVGAELRLWNFFTNSQIAIPQGHSSPIHDLEFDWTGKLLATASEDGTILIWGVPPPK